MLHRLISCFCCSDSAWNGSGNLGALLALGFANFVKLGAAVAVVFAISIGPWVYFKQVSELLGRLFPFQRGLCHAYWAPNFWVVYNLFDKLLITLGKRMGIPSVVAAASSASITSSSGLVEDIPHVVLPTIKSAYTFVLALASMAPVLAKLARKPHPVVFLSSLVYCSLCSFMLGWHVHEKAILLTVIPLGLFACDSVRDAKTFLFLSIVGHYSLFPLLFRPTEAPLKEADSAPNRSLKSNHPCTGGLRL
jgi:alpha-1,3-glucosyltransferase